jgi:hypothetical protein
LNNTDVSEVFTASFFRAINKPRTKILLQISELLGEFFSGEGDVDPHPVRSDPVKYAP